MSFTYSQQFIFFTIFYLFIFSLQKNLIFPLIYSRKLHHFNTPMSTKLFFMWCFYFKWHMHIHLTNYSYFTHNFPHQNMLFLVLYRYATLMLCRTLRTDTELSQASQCVLHQSLLASVYCFKPKLFTLPFRSHPKMDTNVTTASELN